MWMINVSNSTLLKLWTHFSFFFCSSFFFPLHILKTYTPYFIFIQNKRVIYIMLSCILIRYASSMYRKVNVVLHLGRLKTCRQISWIPFKGLFTTCTINLQYMGKQNKERERASKSPDLWFTDVSYGEMYFRKTNPIVNVLYGITLS